MWIVWGFGIIVLVLLVDTIVNQRKPNNITTIPIIKLNTAPRQRKKYPKTELNKELDSIIGSMDYNLKFQEEFSRTVYDEIVKVNPRKAAYMEIREYILHISKCDIKEDYADLLDQLLPMFDKSYRNGEIAEEQEAKQLAKDEAKQDKHDKTLREQYR